MTRCVVYVCLSLCLCVCLCVPCVCVCSMRVFVGVECGEIDRSLHCSNVVAESEIKCWISDGV